MDNNKNPLLETEICHNCKKEVPQQNYLMHVAHCSRNVCICQICNEPVAKTLLEEHKNKYHKCIQCPACKEKLQSSELSSHKREKCPKRMSTCQHCELELPFADLQDHIYHCGARTDRCNECGELVMLKYQKLHRESNHGFIKLNDEPGPVPSWENTSSGRQNGASLANMRDLGTVLEPRPIVEQTSCQREIEREERGLNNEPIRPRDLPRTFVPAYDASEDLRAKVKLARHDLNNIKHSVLAGEERVRELTRHARTPINTNLIASSRKPPPQFQTNLVPYEKNKSYAVNALPLDVSSPNTPKSPKSGCFTYLGTPAQENGHTSIASGPKHALPPLGAPNNNKGAVPRKKKGPAPPVPSQRGPPSPRDEIPCEFCGKMIPQNQLVLHETGCRPDLAQKNPVEGAMSNNNPEVELPCEFCCSLIPASRLLSHQALCDV